MLDSETKRRIDTARDILVGKVPDPKSQVEQITIALIYKFMDDMDAEAEEMGGVRSFFVGEYGKFSWAKLLSPALGGYEMLSLYTEAVEKMTRNEGVPQLFRDIFKNAYLPYRDPETLKLFLKTINDFNYDHSEKLGDAFEYLLSVLGSQGDAGQFRTPRHIIDFMVKVLDPQKDESILDPACGTAGFLISAYKHVMASNAKDGKPGGALKPAERKKLADNIRGYDISPDMVRLSLVNLYLHGFTTPNIFEYDTLASEERWNDTADVILANPPFMSPKGGIMPHKKFSVQSNRSEVLFVDYMAEHLTPNGRAAIIVPEGIIFQSAGAYKQLRKYLIEHNFLWAVVSLPAGAFNPYSGVKTSILFLDKSLAKKTDKVLFVKVENDGFDLGAQRRKIDKDDLPQTLKVLKSFRASILDGKTASFAPTIDSAPNVIASRQGNVIARGDSPEAISPLDEGVASLLKTAPRNDMVLLVSISKLTETGDYNLSADRYREVIRVGKQTHPMVALKDVTEVITKGTTPTTLGHEFVDSGINFVKIESITQGGQIIKDKLSHITQKCYDDFKRSQLAKDDVLFSIAGALGRVAVVPNEILPANTNQALAIIRLTKDVDPEFVSHMLRSDKIVSELSVLKVGVAQYNISLAQISNLQIPLPPLETQRQLVDEIATHQRIIDGARQVVEGWKPEIEIDSNWKTGKVGEICEIKSGGTPSKSKKEYWHNGNIPWYSSGELNDFYTEDSNSKITDLGLQNSNATIFPKGSLLVGMYDTAAFKMSILDRDASFNQAICGIKPNSKIDLSFLYLYFLEMKEEYLTQRVGVRQRNLSKGFIEAIEIPLPPLDIQREIVARIESERAIVHGNRELIRLYEEKVKKVIERVWEG